MDASYEIDEDSSMIRLRLSGRPNAEDLRDVGMQLLDDPRLRPGLSMLVDNSGLEAAGTELLKDVVSGLAVFVERIGPFRCAVVVPSDAAFGMGRMSEFLAEPIGIEVRACRSLSEALSWLGPVRPDAD